MNFPVLVVLSFMVACGFVSTQPVKYDQRQEGELNVRTDVEDVVFVVVAPQDLITGGMGLAAASAAGLLEGYPMRTIPKLGFAHLEKSPYKIDLGKSGSKVKKIQQTGDPNRYNFHEGKNPTKNVAEVKAPVTTEVPEKSTVEMAAEMVQEMSSTTESKTVKKVLKPEDIKKMTVPEKKPLEEKKEEKLNSEPVKNSEEAKTKTDVRNVKNSEGTLKVIGEGTKDPESIFRLEGCGPDAYRDNSGRCVFKEAENPPKQTVL